MGIYNRAGKMPLCKDCVKEAYEQIYSQCKDIRVAIYFTCMEIGIAFKEVYYKQAISQLAKKADMSPIASYLQFLNSNGSRAEGDLTFKDSDDLYDEATAPPDLKMNYVKELDPALVAKWGTSYTPEEINFLESLYKQYEHSNSIETIGAQQNLVLVCKLTLELDRTIANKHYKDMETVNKTLTSALSAGKLRPIDQSNDLSDIGIKSIGNIVEQVAKDGYIPPLPVDVPRDKIDRGFMHMINHVLQLFNRSTITEPEFSVGDDEDDPDAFVQ
jgi:hypothetical protein